MRVGAWLPTTQVEDVLLSPDGQWVSQVLARPDRSVLVLRDHGGRVRHRLAPTGDLLGHCWSADGRLVLLVEEGGCTVVSSGFPGGARSRWVLDGDLTRAHLIDPDLPRGDGPILWLEWASRPGRLELVQLLVSGPAPVTTTERCDRVVLDSTGMPWLGLSWLPSGAATYRLLRHAVDAVDTEILRLQVPDALVTHPDRQTASGLAVSAYFGDDDNLGWGEIDLTTGQHSRIVGGLGRDVEEVVADASGLPLAARLGGRRDRWVSFRPDQTGDLARLEALIGPWNLLARTPDDQTWLVCSEGPTRPPAHHLWTGRPRRLVSLPSPGAVPPVGDVTSVEVEFAARDGRMVQCRLTTDGLTAGRRRRGPAALVVLVHGGPWARTDWSWNPIRIWLARAGYAVLEPDFRGSDGRGREWLELADRDWGGAMQDDLVDARSWAVDAGLADPSRCHVMGSSYGGYAALRAVTSADRGFCSAVALAPATDLVATTRQVIARGGVLAATFRHRVGDPLIDAAELTARSPLTWAHHASAPILLAHGSADPVFSVDQTVAMGAALRAAGRPYEMRIYAGEGHGLARRDNQIDFAHRVLRFLGRAHPSSRTTQSRA